MDLTPRQAELADAALTIVARDGLGAVSFRSVAAESGWSLGAVQKAYATKDELLTAMFARIRATGGQLPATEPGRPTLHAWLTDLFLGILPLTDATRAATLQGSAFSERAAFDPAIATAIAASDQEIRGLLASLVRRAAAEGEIADHVDPDTVAWAFLALAQGAAAQLIYDPKPIDEVRRLGEDAIHRLLGLPI